MKTGSVAVMLDGRLAERVSADKYGGSCAMVLQVRDLEMSTMEARMLDISETGIGLRTDSELFLGQMVIVTPGVEGEAAKKAVVMWSQQDGAGFRSGLKFLRTS